ncbi:hypothetical protein EB796_001834 [Bugula neritina]|uniref:Uncharacterized protein n=1 Tax=Bugula neritina TaxID=10212 RepID=A0A7J7KNU8_BUGNE|nr:hypothetical protein EB796_001834 [Bugula neritina]
MHKRRSSQGDARQSTGSIAPQTVNLDAHFKVIAPPFSHLQSGNEQVLEESRWKIFTWPKRMVLQTLLTLLIVVTWMRI